MTKDTKELVIFISSLVVTTIIISIFLFCMIKHTMTENYIEEMIGEAIDKKIDRRINTLRIPDKFEELKKVFRDHLHDQNGKVAIPY